MEAIERTVYPSALGEAWVITNIHGPVVKLAGPQDEWPCAHYLTEQEARAAAAALREAADEIRDQQERQG